MAQFTSRGGQPPSTRTPPTAAIAVHVYKEHPSPDEKVALTQLRAVLGHYPIFLTAPEDLPIQDYRAVLGDSLFRVKRFKPSYFAGLSGYNKLLTGRAYYEAFGEYDYFLIHHPDAFVFRDELTEWLTRGYDYIGPPVYEYDGTAHPQRLVFCGNGGFSLRRTSAFLKLLDSFVSLKQPRELVEEFLKYNWKGRLRHSLYYLSLLAGGTRIHPALNRLRINEDVTWGMLVPKYVPEFRVAPLEEALKFGMEFNCEKLFEENNRQLPFGCHGWSRPLFRDFWKPHIQAFGHSL